MADETTSWNSLTDRIYSIIEADIDVRKVADVDNIMEDFAIKIGSADIHRIVIDYDKKEISIWPVLQSLRTYQD